MSPDGRLPICYRCLFERDHAKRFATFAGLTCPGCQQADLTLTAFPPAVARKILTVGTFRLSRAKEFCSLCASRSQGGAGETGVMLCYRHESELGRKLAGHPVKVLLAHGAKKFGQKIVLPQKNYEDWLHLCVACVGSAWQKNVTQRAFAPRRPVLDCLVLCR